MKMRAADTAGGSHLRSSVNADGAVILNTRLGSVTILNQTGAAVWQALQRGDDLEIIVTSLARETGASHEVVREDVLELLGSLKEHDLISGSILLRLP